MNTLAPRHLFTAQEKYDFYASAAKRFKAELKLYGATAVVHLENKNDEVFWGKVLRHAYPEGKFRFISASRNIGGNITSGCTQCLQYRPFLSSRFLIAIDSDYRYLSEEPDIDARHFILQTYTYSFENHFCYWQNCQRATAPLTSTQEEAPLTSPQRGEEVPVFHWQTFLESYSRIVYPLLVWQMYLQDIHQEAFPKSVFHRILSLPVGPRSLDNDGAALLQVLRDRCHKLLTHLKRSYPEWDNTWHEARCNAQGVRRDNCYLFVRGHQLYDMIVLQGRKLNRNFERQLTSDLCFDAYPELQRIITDIREIYQIEDLIDKG